MEKNGRLMYAVNNTVMGGSVRSALKDSNANEMVRVSLLLDGA